MTQHEPEDEIDIEEIRRVVGSLTLQELAEIIDHEEDNMAWAARMLKRMEKA